MTADLPRVRAGFADRDATVSRLGDAYAAGYLQDAEYQERSDRAVSAKFRDELDPLVTDLPEQLRDHPLESAPPAVRVSDSGVGRRENMIAVFSGASRQGDWIAPSRVGAYALCGGLELDLRDSIWPAEGTVRVSCALVMGGAAIKVPEGVRVVNHLVPVMGGVDTKGLRASRTGPVLELNGIVLMGGLGIYGPDAEEWYSDQERRHQRHEERRQRRLGR
ncbi:DUF1707 SHOCT-like domain-containing protein [Acidipropionibacterium virtanenii]|uniref:DUF1707 SHOCT-like domain-containing protein n=1 Tax=Acidipropionibacterium virtanenii TaxID=2057246 RepID=UPI0015F0D649|nr:DUF1707 domain-containing protein [Acidipropionibacterium virtanenii]